MEVIDRIDRALLAELETGRAQACPPGPGDAVYHAVFPGGARIRSTICPAVAEACGEDQPSIADAAVVGDIPRYSDGLTARIVAGARNFLPGCLAEGAA